MPVSFRKLSVILIMAAAGALVQPPPARAAASGMPGSHYAGMAWFLTAFELGPWEEYLAHELTPVLPSMRRLPRPQITWLSLSDSLILPDFARELIESRQQPLNLNWDMYEASRLDLSSTGNGSSTGSFERSMLFSGISHQMSDRNRISVSAVLAEQQFSHSMMDTRREDSPIASEFGGGGGYNPYSQVSHGAGVLLGFNSELAPRVDFTAAYQSRINMDELASVRGVHGASADLDIPSRMQVGLDFRTSTRATISMAVSQVFYSDVSAFPSRALPSRFSALLGDSTSPEFNWNDLTIYSLGLRWAHENDLEFSLDFHTRSQPVPTAPSLAGALNGEMAQQSLLMGIGKGVSERSRVQLNASYAPPEFAFGGNVMGVVSDRLDQAVEVSAQYKLDF